MRLIPALLIIYLFSIGQALSQESYSLTECLREALENNFSIKNQRLDNQLNTIRLKTNNSKYLPKINAFATYLNYPGDLPIYMFPSEEGNILSGGSSNGVYPLPLGLQHNYTLGLSVEQTIISADLFLIKIGRSTIDKTNDLLLHKSEEEVIYLVSKTYLELWKNSEKEKIIESNKTRLDEAIKIIEIRIVNEMAYATDLEEALIQQKQLEANRAILLAGLEKQKNYLKFLMGKKSDEQVLIIIDTADFAFNVDDSITTKEDFNSQLIKQDIYSSELRRKNIRNQKFPELKAFLNLMAMSQGSDFNPLSDNQYWYNPSTIGVTLNVPIMNGTLNNNQLEQHQVELEKKGLKKQQNDIYVQMSMDNAKYDVEIQRLILEEKRLNLDLQQRINHRKHDMFTNELIGISELLESNSILTAAESDYSEANINYLLVQLELLKSMSLLKTMLMN